MTILRGVGITQVQECADGGQALDRILQWRPDLAIVDMNMAPVDGLLFTRLIRESSDGIDPFLPIIMLTGHSERSRVEAARDAGVNEFIIKPVSAQVLLARLNSIILRPRSRVRAPDYIGPDRRRREDAKFTGALRRQGDGLDLDSKVV